MSPDYDCNGVQIYCGDAWALAEVLEPQSVNCVVTSPPYWGLRDYQVDGQFGLEPTPDAYVAKLVDIFERLRPALRDDGTVWLNLGDSYAANRGGTQMPAETLAGGVSGRGDRVAKRGRESEYCPTRDPASHGLKHKDLIGIPWRVAFALQKAGWYLRADIIWAKPNPMPESVTDRPTKAHEYLFLLSKRERYYYDAQAIAEPCVVGNNGSTYTLGKTAVNLGARRGQGPRTDKRPPVDTEAAASETLRNKRSVWVVPTEPTPYTHFATYPTDLIRPCIRAGCPVGGVVLDPFLGSGTTAQVCREEGRRCVGFELNPSYVKIAVRNRLAQTSLLTLDMLARWGR